MKAKEIAVSKSMQRRIAVQSEPQGKGKERVKNPRVPIFPPQTVPLVNLLNKILDEELNGDQVKRSLAMGILTRLCVLYAPPIMRERFNVVADLIEYHEEKPDEARARLSPGNSPITNELIVLMDKLFPNGEGLPEPVGAGPL